MMPDERYEFLRQSIESHDRQIGELVEKMAEVAQNIAAQTANIDKLVEMSNRDAIDIAALARIAEAHEHRLDRIEGQEA